MQISYLLTYCGHFSQNGLALKKDERLSKIGIYNYTRQKAPEFCRKQI